MTFSEIKSLIKARVLIETSLEIVSSTRREDGGWKLWCDANATSLSLDVISKIFGSLESYWSNIDAALELLDKYGWLETNDSELVTINPKGCKA